MKRNRPRQHFRKLKGGKKIVVNKGVKKKAKRSMVFKHVYSFNDAHRKNIKTVKMNPEEFLKTTHTESKLSSKSNHESLQEYKDKVLNRSSVDWHKQAIPSKDKDVEIPFLEFDKWGRPIGHEGRHTSQAAIELGLKEIPVTIEQRRYSREWETPPSDFDKRFRYDRNKVKNYLNLEKYPEQPVEEKIIFSGDYRIDQEALDEEDKEFYEIKNRELEERRINLRNEIADLEKEREVADRKSYPGLSADEIELEQYKEKISLDALKRKILGD